MPSIPHSSIRGEVLNNYSVSSVVEIVCHAGYRFPHIKSVVLQVVCHADGTWTDILGIEDVPACECKGTVSCYTVYHITELFT
jgi:Sushi repeat (SCR repeat)